MNRGLMFLLVAALLAGPAWAQSEEPLQPRRGQRGKDVIWIPTKWATVEAMLHLARVDSGDTVVDLGSGDGRIVIAAALRGATARGIEYDAGLVRVSRGFAEMLGVTERVSFVQGDIFESDFTDADVVTLYLLPSLNERLRPALLRLKPGTRIVSHAFGMGDWKPDKIEGHAQLWVVPADVAGTWRFRGSELYLEQRYQRISGSLTTDGTTVYLFDGSVEGGTVRFTAGGVRYSGVVRGESMELDVVAKRWSDPPVTATRVRSDPASR